MNNSTLLFGGVAVIVLVGLLIFVNGKDTEMVVEGIGSKTQEETDAYFHDVDEIDHRLSHAKVSKSPADMTADLNAMGLMPLDGESGAVGYGIITDKGTDEVVVATTHGGVLDSELQKNASDPVWHNHIVKLGEVAMCGENPGVIDITFESPGDVLVKESGLVMAEIPAQFSGTHSLTNKKIVFAPGTNVQKVVQFHLEPKFSDANELQAVCVTDIEEISFDLI